jgi:hypothetical protein
MACSLIGQLPVDLRHGAKLCVSFADPATAKRKIEIALATHWPGGNIE